MTKQDDLSVLHIGPFTTALQQLEGLLAQNNRAFLLGAGCSICAGLPSMSDLTRTILKSENLDTRTKEILTEIRRLFGAETEANIEDYLSELIDMLAITDRRLTRGAAVHEVSLNGSSYTAKELRAAAEHIKMEIHQRISTDYSIETHQRFVQAVHRPLRPGKTTRSQSVDYLVLNYDTVLEDALALECLPYSDGLDGGATGWWDTSTFQRDNLVARVYKLHGSINWCALDDDPLPRRVGYCLRTVSHNSRQILIWPASTKYREAQLDPFAQLAEQARNVLPPRCVAQCVLIICGYRFGDDHINAEVDRALRESNGRLTIVAFTSENAPQGQLEKWHKNSLVRDQVLIFANRGFFHGNTVVPSEQDLPWWKFENVTRLLGG